MAESRELVANVTQQVEHLRWLVTSIKRQRDPGFHVDLQKAIRLAHGCESQHVTGFVVRKVAGRQILWEGMVEEFGLIDHAEAERCYAWHYPEYGRKQSFSILKVPLVNTPQRAVQFHLMAREANIVHSDWLGGGVLPGPGSGKGFANPRRSAGGG